MKAKFRDPPRRAMCLPDLSEQGRFKNPAFFRQTLANGISLHQGIRLRAFKERCDSSLRDLLDRMIWIDDGRERERERERTDRVAMIESI